MKKSIIYTLLACIILLNSCVINRSAQCPTLDNTFFFKMAGAKPTWQYTRNYRQ